MSLIFICDPEVSFLILYLFDIVDRIVSEKNEFTISNKGESAGTQHPRHLLGVSAHFTMGTFGTFSTCNRFSIILSAFLSTLR